MDTDIQKIVEQITREVISRAGGAQAVSTERRSVYSAPAEHVSIGRGSAYDLGPYADEMRKMMAERGNGPAVRRQTVSYTAAPAGNSCHHGSAYDYGTRL